MEQIISKEVIKELRLKLEKEGLTIGEFEDTLGDVLVVVAKVENSVPQNGNGNLLSVAFAVLNQQENLIDVYESAGKMIENVKTMPAQKVALAVDRAVDRAKNETGGREFGKVTKAIVSFFENSSKNYLFVRNTIATLENLYVQGKEEIARWNGFPA